MEIPQIFSDPRFKKTTIITAAIALIYILINLFVVGGDQFLFNLNNSLNLPLAVINSIAAFTVWRMMKPGARNRFLWSGLLFGWVLWTLAEIIWTAYLLFAQETPYPSPADFFWIAGYVPMGIALAARIQTIPTKPTRYQNILILLFSAITVAATIVFILIPVVRDFDSQHLLESIPNLIYPVFDLILVTIVWRLFFTYEKGDYGFAWRLLTLGFILVTISDFTFTYAEWNDLYYPDMQANVISRLADVPYTLSYIMWFIGINALGLLLVKEHPAEMNPRVRLVRTYGHILVYTKADDTVMDFSPNFGNLFADAEVKGKPFADALAISQQEGNEILQRLREEGNIADLRVRVRNRSGELQDVRISGLAIINPQKGYVGANILLRTRVTDESFDDALDLSSKSITRLLLEQSGSIVKAEIAQFLSDYYLSYIKSLMYMAQHEGGQIMSQSLLEKLQEIANKHNWKIRIEPDIILDSADYSLDVLRNALPILLEAAKQLVSEVTSSEAVEARMKEVGAGFSEIVHRDVARYEKPGSELGFADHRKQTE